MPSFGVEDLASLGGRAGCSVHGRLAGGLPGPGPARRGRRRAGRRPEVRRSAGLALRRPRAHAAGGKALRSWAAPLTAGTKWQRHAVWKGARCERGARLIRGGVLWRRVHSGWGVACCYRLGCMLARVAL